MYRQSFPDAEKLMNSFDGVCGRLLTLQCTKVPCSQESRRNGYLLNLGVVPQGILWESKAIKKVKSGKSRPMAMGCGDVQESIKRAVGIEVKVVGVTDHPIPKDEARSWIASACSTGKPTAGRLTLFCF